MEVSSDLLTKKGPFGVFNTKTIMERGNDKDLSTSHGG